MKIDFEFETKYGWFRDALILDDNHTYTDEQIESMKQQRLTNWITILETPTTEIEMSMAEQLMEPNNG